MRAKKYVWYLHLFAQLPIGCTLDMPPKPAHGSMGRKLLLLRGYDVIHKNRFGVLHARGDCKHRSPMLSSPLHDAQGSL
jgi:hypothetical protein